MTTLSIGRLMTDNPEIRGELRLLLERLSLPEIVRSAEADPSGVSTKLWDELVQAGWVGMALPEEQGGGDAAFADLHLALFELGRAGAPAPFKSSVVSVGLFLATQFPDSSLAKRVVADIAEGRRWTAAVAEDGSIDRLSARVDEDRITGLKRFVPDAQGADGILIAARRGEGEIGWFIAEAPFDGVTVRTQHVFGPERMSEVEFADTKAETLAFLPEASLQAWETLWQFAEASWAAGTLVRALEIAVAHVSERHQFGRPIGSFQAVQHRLADTSIGVQSSLHLTRRAAFALDESGVASERAALDVALAYQAARDTAVATVRNVHQVLGGAGFAIEHDLQLFTRRLKSFSVAGPRERDLAESILTRTYSDLDEEGRA